MSRRRGARRGNRSRRRRNNRSSVFVDQVVVTLPKPGIVQYNTTDIRFNTERAYKILQVSFYAHSSDSSTATAQIVIKSPDVALSAGVTGTCASSGLLSLGPNPTRITVRNKRSADYITPAGPTSSLVEFSCFTGAVHGVAKIVIQLDREVFAPSGIRTLSSFVELPVKSTSESDPSTPGTSGSSPGLSDFALLSVDR